MPVALPALLLGREGFRQITVPAPPPAVYYVPIRPGELSAIGIRGRIDLSQLKRRFVRDVTLEDPTSSWLSYVEVTHVDAH